MSVIREMLSSGATLGDVAAAFNMSVPTFHRRIKRDPKLAEQVKLGRAAFFARRAEMVVRYAILMRGNGDDRTLQTYGGDNGEIPHHDA